MVTVNLIATLNQSTLTLFILSSFLVSESLLASQGLAASKYSRRFLLYYSSPDTRFDRLLHIVFEVCRRSAKRLFDARHHITVSAIKHYREQLMQEP